MTNEFLHFEKISRQTWQSLHRKTTPPLTEEELESIKSFNDQISLQDVTDVYLPLAHLITSVPRMIWPFQKEFSFNVKANPNLLSLGFLVVLPLENPQPVAYFKSYCLVRLQMLGLSW